MRIVWKHLPLEIHPQAPGAHLASVAAHKQGRFWEFHDRVFANQGELNVTRYLQYAEELGLDLERFHADLTDSSNNKSIGDDRVEAASLQVTGTPAFFINGRFLRGAKPFEAFATIIDEELKRLGLPLPAETGTR